MQDKMIAERFRVDWNRRASRNVRHAMRALRWLENADFNACQQRPRLLAELGHVRGLQMSVQRRGAVPLFDDRDDVRPLRRHAGDVGRQIDGRAVLDAAPFLVDRRREFRKQREKFVARAVEDFDRGDDVDHVASPRVR